MICVFHVKNEHKLECDNCKRKYVYMISTDKRYGTINFCTKCIRMLGRYIDRIKEGM